MARALIVGVSGQDGAYLARLLDARGVEIWGTTRSTVPPPALAALGVADAVSVRQTPASADAVAALLDAAQPDAIYHLAGVHAADPLHAGRHAAGDAHRAISRHGLQGAAERAPDPVVRRGVGGGVRRHRRHPRDRGDAVQCADPLRRGKRRGRTGCRARAQRRWPVRRRRADVPARIALCAAPCTGTAYHRRRPCAGASSAAALLRLGNLDVANARLVVGRPNMSTR